MWSIDISYRLFCCRFRIVCIEHFKSCFDTAHICYTFKWLKETNIMLEILCQILYFMSTYVSALKLNCICTWIFADTISYRLSRIVFFHWGSYWLLSRNDDLAISQHVSTAPNEPFNYIFTCNMLDTFWGGCTGA